VVIQLLGSMLVLFLVYAVVGFGLARLIGLRGLWAAAVAPAFATTVIGLASTVAPFIGLRWSVLPTVLCAAVIAAGVVPVRVLLARRHGGRPFGRRADGGSAAWNPWWTLAALLVAATVITVRVMQIVGAPDSISQTFDNVFHLNAIRYILDEGTASALQIGQMTSPGGGVPFYPAAWHATAALVVQMTGASIPVVVTAQTLVIAALVWPAGVMLLTRTLAGPGAAVTVSAAIAATAVPAFPFLPMDYGVLYPYQLALALVPVALAATARMLGIGDGGGLAPGWWALVVVGVLPGVALAHPGGFVAWLALSVPLVLVCAWRLWSRFASVRGRLCVIGGLIAYAGVGLVLLKLLRPPLPTRQWPTVTDPLTAAGDAFAVILYYPVPAVVAAAGVVLGLIWAVVERRRESLALVGMWLVGVVLFVVVTSSPWGNLRDALTGSWYNNWPRLAALAAVALVPLAAYGFARTGLWLSRRLRLSARSGALIGSAATLALLVAAQPAVQAAVEQARPSFTMDADALLLSADEAALLQRIDRHVPEGEVIAGNPYTGAGLAYAYSGREVLMPHILMDVSEEMAEVNENLRDAVTDPDVCAAVDALDVGFVLDFGSREVHGGENPLPGLTDLESSPAVRLIDQQGDARLFEVIACGRG